MAIDPYGLALKTVLYPAWERLRGRPTFDLLASLRRTERASVDELTAIRTGYLRRLLRHAGSQTAHYKSVFELAGFHADDLQSLDDLRRIPVLQRPIAKTSVEARTAPWPGVAVSKTTSGSTGQPLEVRYSEESRHWRDATKWRGYGWGNYHMGDKGLILWGVPAVTPSRLQRARLAIDHKLRRDVYANCMVRSKEKLLEMTHLIIREKPSAVTGYAQAIADLARFVNAEGLRAWKDIPVIYGAERLWPHDREDIAKAFGDGIFETYGCREFMLMGSECEAHAGLHEQAENLIVEILVAEPDGRYRPAKPGEQGEVAVTDLHNLACPFIRYLTGDLAIEGDGSLCPCGRTLRRFGPVEGRVTETMRDIDGNRVEGLVFNILFLNVAQYTRQFQVVQRKDRSLLLRIVPVGATLDPGAESLIREYVTKHVRGVPLTIELVADIEMSRAGKLKRVVVEN